jgi:hypothetical protein
MLEEVSISNYKSILHQQFKMGRINVFVGAAGSGKTNILEALGIASAAHDNALTPESLSKRGVNPVKPSLMFHSPSGGQYQSNAIDVVWYEKNSWKKSKAVCSDADGDNPSWKEMSWYEQAYIDKINNLIVAISDGTIDGEYPFADEAKNVILNAVFRGSRAFREYLIYNIRMDALCGKTNESNAVPLGIFGEGLNKLLSSFTDVQMQELTGLCTAVDDNLPALFYLALFYEKRTPAFFAVDNIDALVSPDLCSELINAAAGLVAKNKKQALITVSDYEIVGNLDVSDPGIKLFGVNKSSDGQTTIVEEITDQILK